MLVDPADPTPNRRHIARSLGLLFLIEGTLGLVWLLLPHVAAQALPLALVCVLAQVVTAIVAAIVEIARSLGLQVIAEGVEGEVQFERLRQLGCHGAQGYLFSGPLPGEAFAAFLADEAPAVAVAVA